MSAAPLPGATIAVPISADAAAGNATITIGCDTATTGGTSATVVVLPAPPANPITTLTNCLSSASDKSTCITALLGTPTSPQLACITNNLQAILRTVQADLTTMTAPTQAQITDSITSLVNCVIPTTSPPKNISSSGGATTSTPPVSTSAQAPAAKPVVGTPTFTG